MSFIESLIYGFISGLSEFMPVSTQGHQALMLRLFGLSVREPGRDVFVHIGILLALVSACRTMFNHIMTKQRVTVNTRRGRRVERRSTYDLQLVKAALMPLILGMFGYLATRKLENSMAWLAILFALNGIIVMVPEYTRRGNKDGRFMSGWDSIALGLFGALSALPGISRNATIHFYTTMRGVDRSHSLNWFFLLSVPALILFILFDIVNLFILPLGTVTFISFLWYLVSAVAAFFGAHLSISLVRYLSFP